MMLLNVDKIREITTHIVLVIESTMDHCHKQKRHRWEEAKCKFGSKTTLTRVLKISSQTPFMVSTMFQ